ncbi:Zinc finger protein with KRAB and SCAN domains 4 [Pteropus alecto]|uniref:Zinc finger protein with KRAB and SCAN domains 4 n=2 Tax=Pteropus alecto TaxID=9402 RepID=L5JWH4_PTEAL|nr:Zinc finger protein with KRAB and SCAN domains 4 [Pteropus alecto]
MAVLTPARRSRSPQFQPVKALLERESVGPQPSADGALQVSGLALGGCHTGDTGVAARLTPESQGLLKMEDVALTLSSGWTELDSSPVNLHSDERQEDGGH